MTPRATSAAIGDDQPGDVGQEVGTVANPGKFGRHGPEEPVAIIEIVGPFAVAQEVGLRDLDLNDRQPTLGVDRHHVGATTVGQRHFADREQVLTAKQPGHAPRDLGCNGWRILETGRDQRFGGGTHPRTLEHKGTGT